MELTLAEQKKLLNESVIPQLPSCCQYTEQPVSDETLASSEEEDTDISDVASESDDSVVEDSNLDYET
ncbi:hypothetical protein T4B_3146 [Trichinella pseudospiralis]|uniref:Uncharacterized protein n=1 Tax=Trichinella pseudospiralis TaxID=6337 RepID=A0A0V1J1C4_TRIPS|nr:hypothetical protein T4A_5729 [Trichinella pseudospiralis]KRZ28750.1 hypothetical protein T4B_1771 [Trichinella pseudospiralis]KRZ28779.1 hypothetical protein T4B_3146 [Trichinella pseudospiralis]